MKPLLIALSCLFFALPANAQVYKDYPDLKAKKIQPTVAQIDEAFAVNDECVASPIVQKFYDCECLSATFLDMRARNPDTKQDAIITAARKQCANTVSIAGDSYQRCLTWATATRPDYERYCSCYANVYATNFAKKPTDSIRGREMQMTYALNKCSTGLEVRQDQARQAEIERLKTQGVYDTLFPGATAPAPVPQR